MIAPVGANSGTNFLLAQLSGSAVGAQAVRSIAAPTKAGADSLRPEEIDTLHPADRSYDAEAGGRSLRGGAEPVVSTAFQRNADGDEASFSSRADDLTQEERQQVEKLRLRDSEVRQHEAAHKAAAGGLAVGGPSFEYQAGPDGKRYAVGGHVQVDTSPGATPEETLQKAQQIQRAALAPGDPSSADRAVAAKAARMAADAQQELASSHKNSQDERGSQGVDEPKPEETPAVNASIGIDLFA